MDSPGEILKVIEGKTYSTRTSILIARGYMHQRHREQMDRTIFIYRTKDGDFFKVMVAHHPVEHKDIERISELEALNLFGTLSERIVDLEVAFPIPNS